MEFKVGQEVHDLEYEQGEFTLKINGKVLEVLQDGINIRIFAPKYRFTGGNHAHPGRIFKDDGRGSTPVFIRYNQLV